MVALNYVVSPNRAHQFFEGGMRLVILNTYDEVSEWTATYIRDKIKTFNPTADKPFVLGLPTGNEMKFLVRSSRCFSIRWHPIGHV